MLLLPTPYIVQFTSFIVHPYDPTAAEFSAATAAAAAAAATAEAAVAVTATVAAVFSVAWAIFPLTLTAALLRKEYSCLGRVLSGGRGGFLPAFFGYCFCR